MASHSYATPVDDQNAWRDAAARARPGLLPAHIVAFLQGGVAVTLGARSPAGRPLVGGGVGCRVTAAGEVRILLSRGANAALIEAVAAGSAVAATFSRARDHRSIQIKAPGAEVRDIAPDDRIEAARQSAILADELMELGYDRPQALAYAHCGAADLVALAFRPARVFTQTPGPGAGAELSA